ncbi:hypothetical protein EB796_020387 [Bugula neritina]|uniref:Uncharacterized protein n=1 Tax=Bugula neritina TaxID=10212 RepID=A0A7J7J6E4_BUGNE|nr:hypothetical protein EB796_020387 [Bugula neritina]
MAAEVQCARAYRNVTRLNATQKVSEQARALVYENDVSKDRSIKNTTGWTMPCAKFICQEGQEKQTNDELEVDESNTPLITSSVRSNTYGGTDQPEGMGLANNGLEGSQSTISMQTSSLDETQSAPTQPPLTPDINSENAANANSTAAVSSTAATNIATTTFGFNLAILLSIALIIFEVLCDYSTLMKKLVITSFYWTRIAYDFILLGVTGTATAIIYRKVKPQSNRLHSETILLLVAATGEFVYLYFGLLGASAAFNQNSVDTMMTQVTNHTGSYICNESMLQEISYVNFFTNIIDIVQIAMQTLLILIMKENVNNHLPIDLNYLTTKKQKIFLQSLWYLCACNFFKWVTDSFIEGHFFLKSSETKTLVFSETTWTAITQTTYPLVLFYRFHSVHMILELLDKIIS